MPSKWENRVEKIIDLMEKGKSDQEISDEFGVSKSYLKNKMVKLRKKGLLPYRKDIKKREKTEYFSEDGRQKMEVNFVDKKKAECNWEEFLNTAIDMQKQKQKKSISQDEARIEIQTDKPFAIAFSSDWHLGASSTDYVSFLKHIRLITKVNNLMVGVLGDLADNFVQSSKKGGMFSSLFSPQDQQDVLKSIFEDLGENVIFKTSGNHDDWTYFESGFDFAKYMYKNCRSAPYLRSGGGINLVVNGDIEYRIYAKHKYRYNSSFNLTHTVKRMFEQESPFDVGVIAHHHTPAVEQVSRWHGKYKRDIVCIRTGSYKIDDKWAKSQGFGGGEIGVPTVIFFSDKKKMIPFKRIEDAVMFLKGVENNGN